MANTQTKFDPADTNRDSVIDKKEAAAWKKGGSKKVTAELTAADYGFAASLIASDDTGSLKDFFDWFAAYTQRTGRVPTENELDRKKKQVEWFQKWNSNQQEALKDKALNPTDYAESVRLRADDIRATADSLGVPLTEAEVGYLAEQSRINKWTATQIQNNLAPYLKSAVGENRDLTGAAGDVQTELSDWARMNGIDISPDQMARYVSSGAFGKQSINDIKAELRKTYMAGAYPAWADKIAAGVDIADIAAPYKSTMAKLLEIDENNIDLNDQLLQRGLQGVGADGKPSVVPLYEFQKQIRNDPRWQKTDNAYSAYASVADDILSMFGFR